MPVICTAPSSRVSSPPDLVPFDLGHRRRREHRVCRRRCRRPRACAGTARSRRPSTVADAAGDGLRECGRRVPSKRVCVIPSGCAMRSWNACSNDVPPSRSISRPATAKPDAAVVELRSRATTTDRRRPRSMPTQRAQGRRRVALTSRRRQPGGVREELAHGDVRLGAVERREVGRHRVVEAQLALVDERHHRRRREPLAGRRDRHHRPRRGVADRERDARCRRRARRTAPRRPGRRRAPAPASRRRPRRTNRAAPAAVDSATTHGRAEHVAARAATSFWRRSTVYRHGSVRRRNGGGGASGLGDRLHDHVDLAFGLVVVQQQVVAVDRCTSRPDGRAPARSRRAPAPSSRPRSTSPSRQSITVGRWRDPWRRGSMHTMGDDRSLSSVPCPWSSSR